MLDLSQNQLSRVASLAANLPALAVLNLGRSVCGRQVYLADVLGNSKTAICWMILMPVVV